MTFIIAEVGSNWRSFEEAKDSISMAKVCGADAVKFQMFSPNDLYGVEYDGPAVNPFLSQHWIPKLKLKADSVGIEFMCSTFSPEGLKFIDPFVKRHKIASSDLPYVELLEAAKATSKPVLLSVGGSSVTDMKLALNVFGDSYPVMPLYCVSNYPSCNVNLFCIDDLMRSLGRRVGYSCHTQDWYTPVAAVKFHAAPVIEKHFKLKDDMDTPDSPHSLNPSDFKRMVDMINGNIKCHFPDPQELEFQLKHKRRLIVTKPVKEGESFIYGDNYGCYRSLKEDRNGLSGFLAATINGKISIKDHAPGDPVGPDSFE